VTKARLTRWLIAAAALLALAVAPVVSTAPSSVYRIDHVVDGDTVDLANGAKVRLVQIDTPEVTSGRSATGRGRPRSRSGCCRTGRRFDSRPIPRQTASTATGGCCAT
jgi:hypothetical protein